MTKQKGKSCEPAPVSHSTAGQPHSIPAPGATFAPCLLCICCSITCFVTAAVTACTTIANKYFFISSFFSSTPFLVLLKRDKFLISLSVPGSSPFPGAALPLRVAPRLHFQVLCALVPSMPRNRDKHHSPNQ